VGAGQCYGYFYEPSALAGEGVFHAVGEQFVDYYPYGLQFFCIDQEIIDVLLDPDQGAVGEIPYDLVDQGRQVIPDGYFGVVEGPV